MARNYRAASRSLGGAGEIDLIAFEGVPSTLVFVEVKTRAKHGMVAAEAAVNAAKQRRLQRLAALYRMRRRHCGPYRFDVVVIYGPEDPKPHLTLHRAAFSS
ncbi:MAG: YraN family protein [Terriglobales bacterium]